VWLDKTQPVVDEEATEAQWLGLLVENAILDGFEQRTGLAVIDRQAEYVGPRPWHKATPDGRVVGSGPIDAKFTGDAPWNDDETADGIPDHYVCQIQWQIHCAGADMGHLVAIHTAFGRRQFRIYNVPRDQRVIDQLATLVDRFWLDYVEPKKLPPVDGSDATDKALKVLYPTHDPDTTVEIDPQIVAADRQARAQLKAAEEFAAFAKQRVQEAMGAAETAVVDGKPVYTWRTQQTRRDDVKAIAEARKINPRGVAWIPVNVTESRVLRLKGKA